MESEKFRGRTDIVIQGDSVKFKIQVVVESKSGETQLIQEILRIDKGNLQPENLGIMLDQGKELGS
ncbi:hypothetical protein H6G33_25415 [Calothrix sp. FACHB-1219]|uniref:hypothetical protein n=1 Tax=unclassified Calothrix TaxID=2619626 RepID=UPI001686A4E4|nr:MULTISPECIES: hypothetical protein [unclassified Calothrix]MBD2206470.1 hypothetical protein [Calothrix sp. FACHB-168]MBD2220347.1 hypothetical protein [Calothrix sp. FACHB-1219]